MTVDEKRRELKSALVSMMFVWGDPLSPDAAAEACMTTEEEAEALLRELADEAEVLGTGIRVREIDGSFQLVTPAENDEYIQRLCMPVRPKKLSQAGLEVLAVIAYRQPVTKVDIEAIRGVRSDGVIERLIKNELIEEKGKADLPGRPVLYGTTRVFLERLGISSLEELPEVEDIEGAIRVEHKEHE